MSARVNLECEILIAPFPVHAKVGKANEESRSAACKMVGVYSSCSEAVSVTPLPLHFCWTASSLKMSYTVFDRNANTKQVPSV
jgi:hypothetical protein